MPEEVQAPKPSVVLCPNCGTIVDVPAEAPTSVDERNWKEIFVEECKSIAGAPDIAKLTEWEDKYGTLYFVVLTPTLVLIYRPVKGSEYENIVSSIIKFTGQQQNVSQGELQALSQKMLQEQVAFRCVIWPKLSPADVASMPAGLVPTMSQLIHAVSHFFDPASIPTMINQLN